MQNKMKLKSTIDLVKSYPQMLMKPMLRDRLKTCFFLCYASNSIKSKVVHFSEEVAALLGISIEDTKSNEFTNIFSGKELLPHSRPYSMSYAGHQFGNWAGQLETGELLSSQK
jgi:uncharacterized protein YdiU (UPF0061 family)